MLVVGRAAAPDSRDLLAMAWALPEYDVQTVNAAGRKLATERFPLADDAMLRVINNWRSIHSYPLNAFQLTLRRRARQIENNITVPQRIKRLESIHAKLVRQPTMRLSQMQDIAGCRVIFQQIGSVQALVQRYKKGSRKGKLEHRLLGEKDYIAHPKSDGYRSHHMVYEYTGSAKTSAWTGRRVEIQIRTQLQHAWATAVEAVGIFTKQALKSNQGDADWIRFFTLMGTAVAAIEGCNSVPGTPTNKNELTSELNALSNKLHVQQTLVAYNIGLNYTSKRIKDAKYFLLDLDAVNSKITVSQFQALQSEAANKAYTEAERGVAEDSGRQVVLVSVDSIAALKRAYPNYFLDTERFAELVTQVLAKRYPDPLPILAGDDA